MTERTDQEARPLRAVGRRGRALLRRSAIDVTPLQHVDFRRLWVGNSVAFVGFQLTAVAVPVQVYELTGSSFWVGMLGAIGFVPLVVFGLWGGAIADAVDRRVLLLVSSLVLWACTGVLLVQALLGLDSLPVLLGVVAVQAASFAAASSVRGAIVPRVLPLELVPPRTRCRSRPATPAWCSVHCWPRFSSPAGVSVSHTPSMLRCSAWLCTQRCGCLPCRRSHRVQLRDCVPCSMGWRSSSPVRYC